MTEKKRMELHELEVQLIRAKNLLGVVGGAYKHLGSDGAYAYRGVVLREEDLGVMVRYSPLSHPDVEFVRPFSEFVKRFAVYYMPPSGRG